MPMILVFDVSDSPHSRALIMDTFIDGNGAKCRSMNFMAHPYKCFAIMVIIDTSVTAPATNRNGFPHRIFSFIQALKYASGLTGISGRFTLMSTISSSSLGPHILIRYILSPFVDNLCRFAFYKSSTNHYYTSQSQ
jgi:hypothetical protein